MGVFKIKFYRFKYLGHIGCCRFQQRGVEGCGQGQFFMENVFIFQMCAKKVYALCCSGNGGLFFTVFVDQPDIVNTGFRNHLLGSFFPVKNHHDPAGVFF